MGRRVFAVSDIHVDYDVNAQWVRKLSNLDYRDDLLILAGDVTDRSYEFASCLHTLTSRFHKVLFVPGNHDLWVRGESVARTSFEKFDEVTATVERSGASMQPHWEGDVLFAPLLGWYDYSFGEPSEDLLNVWTDYRACQWPAGLSPDEISLYFTRLNRPLSTQGARKIITFSHFMPRIDLIPSYVPLQHRMLDPVLGSARIEQQLRQLQANIHVYGHSHINRRVAIDGVMYVNNAFGYPGEERIAARQLLCIDEL